jgi:hypothetical protein
VFSLRSFLRRCHDKLGPAELVATEHATGFWRSAALMAVVNLRIADHLDNEECLSATEIAQLANAHPHLVERLMRAVAALGFFKRNKNGQYSNNSLSHCLRHTRGPRASLGWALRFQHRIQWQAWSSLDNVVRQGKTSFELESPLFSQGGEFGLTTESKVAEQRGLFQRMEQDAEARVLFHSAMESVTSLATKELINSYPWEKHSRFLDIGGGKGHFATSLHAKFSQLKKAVLDLPFAFESFPVSDRDKLPFSIVEGSFFDLFGLIAQYDVLMLKHILHDWNDSQSGQILSEIRNNMHPKATLLIVETFQKQSGKDLLSAFADLEMMHSFQSKERSLEDFDVLLHSNGFELTQVVHTFSPFHILVCHKKV